MGLADAFQPARLGLTAQDCFTDRIDERQAVVQSARRVRGDLARGVRVEEVAEPRSNVLVFYGVGGIGKTTLSIQLQHELDQLVGRSVSVRLDFANGNLRDPEEVLLRLRAALVPAAPKLLAFDSLLTLYWSVVHPNVSLRDYLRPRTWARDLGVGDPVEGGIVELLESAIDGSTFGLVGITRRLATESARKLFERTMRSRLANKCPRYSEALDAPPDELLPFLSYFLAWDLEQIQTEQRLRGEEILLPVVFYDTWEEVQIASHSVGSLEDFCALQAWNSPNMLHVFTGRDQLTWHEPGSSARLQKAGQAWPGLAPGAVAEPRQHLLGTLSEEDCHQYLSQALTLNGEPALPFEVRQSIARSSGGHPYHLDLAVDVCADLLRRNEPLTLDLLEQPFPELVNRIIRHLADGERDLLFAASVVGSFSSQTLKYLVPGASTTAVSRFEGRHLVRATGEPWLPYALHDNVRQAVFRATSVAEGAWPTDEWDACTRRAMRWLESEILGEAGAPTESSRLAQGSVIYARLLGSADPSPEFVGMVARLRTLGMTHVLDSVLQALDTATAGSQGRELVSCIRFAQDGHSSRRALVRAVLAILPTTENADVRALLVEIALLAALTSGDLDVGRQLLNAKTATPGDAFDLSLREGDLVAAKVALGMAPPGHDPVGAAAWLDRAGHLELAEGRLDEALTAFSSAFDSAKRAGSPLWKARAARHAATVTAILRHHDADGWLSAAQHYNSEDLEPIGVQQCHAVTALRLADQGRLPEAIELFRTTRDTLVRNEAWVDVGLLMFLEVLAVRRSASDVSPEFARSVQDEGLWHAMPWRGEIARYWLDLPPASTVVWTRPLTDIYSGWAAVV